MTDIGTMTLPRPVLPGSTYLVTRRCLGRRFLLRPDPELNRAFLYCLAVATKKYGMEVHALGVMSNHYHVVLTDPEGVLPLFAAWLNRHLAMCVKRLRGWDEVVWEPNVQVSAVELTGPEEVLDKVAYTLVNPVSAGLVRTPGPVARSAQHRAVSSTTQGRRQTAPCPGSRTPRPRRSRFAGSRPQGFRSDTPTFRPFGPWSNIGFGGFTKSGATTSVARRSNALRSPPNPIRRRHASDGAPRFPPSRDNDGDKR